MKTYDFDRIIERKGTDCVKYDAMEGHFRRGDLTPLWVADMDFETPDFIVDALEERMKHHVFGYPKQPDDYWPAVIDWVREHHGWEVRREWMTYIPGIVKGIGMVVNVFVAPDEKVVIQPPVYHPFRIVPEKNRREVVYNPMIAHEDGTYSMDLEGLERILSSDPKCRMLILANPHNPAGIVWDRETLVQLAEICARHGVLVISDEIHCDMALFGNKHIPFASVSDTAARISITFQAPSKTFNIAGIVSSYAIVPDEGIREKFFGWLEASEMDSAPIFSPIATVAAFRKGEGWRRQMVSYLEGNVVAVEEFLRERIPGIRPLRPQASFLIWLDCRGLGLDHDALIDLFVNKAGLALNDGAVFGKEGSGFMRLNIGAPRSMVISALGRLADAVDSIK